METPPRPVPPLHAVTDDAVLARPDFLSAARRVIEAGGPRLALHLRGPAASGREMHRLASSLAAAANDAGATLIVNDRVDVALAAGAHGVQIGARGLLPGDARRLVGDARLLGVSVHSAAEAEAAVDARPDFFLAGTVYQTASHSGKPADGLQAISRLAPFAVPLIAIGGITPERVPAVLAAEATGIAAIRGIWDAADEGEAVRKYLARLPGG
ncbi:MAG TPA: thiamine phosphate synthase [Longimicrobiaceae bacterium]|nr:thiamine phosphate synthase [Longimicrobiaceae bacterium]